MLTSRFIASLWAWSSWICSSVRFVCYKIDFNWLQCSLTWSSWCDWLKLASRCVSSIRFCKLGFWIADRGTAFLTVAGSGLIGRAEQTRTTFLHSGVAWAAFEIKSLYYYLTRLRFCCTYSSRLEYGCRFSTYTRLYVSFYSVRAACNSAISSFTNRKPYSCNFVSSSWNLIISSEACACTCNSAIYLRKSVMLLEISAQRMKSLSTRASRLSNT